MSDRGESHLRSLTWDSRPGFIGPSGFRSGYFKAGGMADNRDQKATSERKVTLAFERQRFRSSGPL